MDIAQPEPASGKRKGAAVVLDRLTRRYGSIVALDEITAAIPNDAYVAVLGPSGSGKTVLLRVIAGFEQPDSGAVCVAGEPIDTLPPYLRGFGFVFQNFALFPHLNVRDNIGFGLLHRAVAPIKNKAAVQERVSSMIDLVGLTGLGDRGVHQISGGQRQRVALARTLVTEPRLVLLDEPLGALDANLRTRMRAELQRIRERLRVTFLHVTGSESEALATGEQIIVLDRGRVAQFADPDTVYNRPATPSVAKFLSCYNIYPGRLDGHWFLTEHGEFTVNGATVLTGDPAYCIREDLIRVNDETDPPAKDEAGVRARFITSEYSGASVTYFFDRPGSAPLEVEAHLSHRRPEDLVPQRVYWLVWRAVDAVVFA